MPPSFYIVGAFTVITAVAAMTLRNLVHCALCLAMTFLGVAGLFLQLSAPFLAFAQILVYVGAVAILIVFAILLTRGSQEPGEKRTSGLLYSVPLVIGVPLILLYAVFSSPLPDLGIAVDRGPEVRELGGALMTTHVIPLEIIGILLTVALLGAVVLALPERGSAMEGQGGKSA